MLFAVGLTSASTSRPSLRFGRHVNLSVERTRRTKMRALNKMITPPPANSRNMRAYMQAILEATGLLAGERFDISRFMRNYRTHLESGRLQRHSDGSYSLSESGRQYFISRLTDDPVVKGQLVSRAEVVEMLHNITANRPADGWTTIG